MHAGPRVARAYLAGCQLQQRYKDCAKCEQYKRRFCARPVAGRCCRKGLAALVKQLLLRVQAGVLFGHLLLLCFELVALLNKLAPMCIQLRVLFFKLQTLLEKVRPLVV